MPLPVIPLRKLLDAATPGPWQIVTGDHGELEIVNSPDSLTYITALDSLDEEDARLIALAPELAALCLDMGEMLRKVAKVPFDLSEIDPLLARLSSLGSPPVQREET